MILIHQKSLFRKGIMLRFEINNCRLLNIYSFPTVKLLKPKVIFTTGKIASKRMQVSVKKLKKNSSIWNENLHIIAICLHINTFSIIRKSEK